MNPKKLSIIFVTNNYFPYQGGVVSSITNSVEALRKNGHSVTIITLDFAHQKTYEPGVVRLYCPIKFMYKTNHMAIPLLPYYQIQQLLQKIKPDIIHAHHPFLLGKAALKAAKNLDIPLIFTYHTLYDHYLHYIPLPKIITQPLVNKLVKSFCINSHGVIAPSNAVKERLTACSISTKTEIIPSAIASHFFQKNSRNISFTPPLHLLSVSRFTKEKNIYFLLDMLALLNPNKFIVTFAGYGSEYPSLEKYAYCTKKLSPQNVKFIEKPSKQQLKELYHNAHLFIFASQTETQGLVLAEAMAHGIPVIALNGPGQQDIIKNGYNGFLVSSIYGMKEKIEYSIAYEKRYQIMQQHAFNTAQNYSEDKFIEKLMNFYHAILAKNTINIHKKSLTNHSMRMTN